MLHLVPNPVRPLAVLAAALALTTAAGAQTYTAKAGDTVGGTGDSSTGSYPTVAFWDGTWTHSVRHAWSRADQGALKGVALCTTDAKYNMEAWAIGAFQFDDLVFTSTGSGTIQVGLFLTIDGNSAVTNGNGFYVGLKHGTHNIGEASRDVTGPGNATGDLAGWNMSGQFSFEHTMTVPVNTPVSLSIQMAVSASAVAGGHAADGHYTLRLGGAVPLALPGTRYNVFNLPPGVTVDSVEGGISKNRWVLPERLHLYADSSLVAPGESLTLVPWNGVPGQPVGLSIGFGPALAPPPFGSPAPIGLSRWSGFLGNLDADGWLWLDPIPNAPELAGETMRIRAISLDASGARMRSEEISVQFQ